MRDRGIVVDRSSKVPLHRQLEIAIRDAILSGRLKAGERILSSREMRTHLGLSRNTIVTALDQLHAEGYLTQVRGVGTFVADAMQGRSRIDPAPADGAISPSETAARFVSVSELAKNLDVSVPFRPGIPALELFPSAQFKRAISAREWTSRVLDYPAALGDPRLREAISRRLQQTRGVACVPDQVLITAGAQAAFSLIARVLLKKNDTVVVEDPGYPNVRAAFLAHGARLVGAPVDDAGINVQSISRRSAALIHLTPSHQYPTGAVLSLERRFAVLDWAAKQNAWIIEDDYDSEFNYTGNPQPALHGLDGGRRVIYVGTFSKVLAPSLRVAYVVVPRSLHESFEAAQQVMGGHPSGMLQSALAKFIENGQFARHISKMRAVYDERRRFAAAEFGRAFGSFARVQDSRAGLHFVVHFAKAIEDASFSARAAEKGIIVPALSSYFYGAAHQNGIVVGYAGSSPAAVKRAIAVLRDLRERT